MERKYKAFISYRHMPLDISVAKKIHKRIEHYIIPKNLRKNGAKKLGYVFRDQDELPTSSDLTSNIQTALDNAEFLIVICTPETPKSYWVRNEIRYFLKHHDRNHVLAVLANGTPNDAFPSELTDVLADDGTVVEQIEPMAANLVAESDWRRNRLFGVESLRILAPLIGCSFDELYRREQRYKLRKIGISVGMAMAVAVAFIGVLLNRNAEIKANYEQALKNQSSYLASESLKLLQGNDRLSAISLAIAALPSEANDRPLVSRAVFALGCAVNAYTTPGNDNWIATGALHHANTVKDFQLNEAETVICTYTDASVVSCWRTDNLQKLWEFPLEGDSYFSGIEGFFNDSNLVAWSSAYIYNFDVDTGEVVWRVSADQLSGNNWDIIVSVSLVNSEKEIVAFCGERIFRIDAADGSVISAFQVPTVIIDDVETVFQYSKTQISQDGRSLAFCFPPVMCLEM